MKNKIWAYLMGLLSGMMLLSGGYAAVNTVLTATPTSQSFYLNGHRVQFEAYEIHGNNFVKLRDIGKAVDFGVTYDGGTNTVYIDSDSPYVEEVTQPVPTTCTPHTSITEESVQATLLSLKKRYPHCSIFPSPYHSTSGGPYYSGMNCAGWATLCSDTAFGDLPWRRVDRPSWDQIRPGDLIEYDTEQARHVVVVVSKTGDTLSFTDSGTDQKVYWGGTVPRSWLESRTGLVLYTRYPS